MPLSSNPPSRRSARRCALALAVLAAFQAAVAAPTAMSVAQPTRLGAQDAVVGPLPLNQPMHVVVALRMRDRAGLDARIADNARAHVAGRAPRLLTSADFMAAHAPTAAQAQAVAGWLAQHGFTNVQVAPNRLLVTADGTAASARDAFMTTFAQVRTRDGRIAYANTDAVRIPSALGGTVLSVLGLQTVHQAKSFLQPYQPGGVHTMSNVGHNPLDFGPIYGATGVTTAATVTVGIVTDGNLAQVKTDLNKFTTDNGLAAITTQTVNTGGSAGSDTSGVGEWDLDSQSVVGMAGGTVGKLIFYNMPDLFDSSVTTAMNSAVTANVAKVVSISLGLCETDEQGDGAAAAQDQVLATAVAQGQTFSISTGDSGADECPSDGMSTPVPSWPASSQYVIAVGGTTLSTNGTVWLGETVWSGTGGAPSTFEAKPAWQGSTVPGTKRGTPDISFDGNPATGALIINNGVTKQFGGTSLSAPLFAGWWARVIAAKGTTVGFAGPALFGLPVGDLHDVVSGNNNGETAAVGYDFASGRGSVILSSAVAHIGTPTNVAPTANFSFTTAALTANFTDSSTDSDGTVVSHAWAFGDGGTSTATSPSHTYAAAGTYTVSEMVTDDDGATGSKAVPVTVATTSQVLKNPGFESGVVNWVGGTGVINNTGTQPAHAGTWDAWLGGKGTDQAQTMYQQVAIPAGWSSAKLRIWLHVDTAETTTTKQNDKLTIRVTDAAGATLATLGTFSNLDAAAGYVTHTWDMTPWIGQTVRIKFTGNENAGLQTSFVLDDVTLTLR